jgi:regulator of PEP synthase PpsR (kinase-PPPase family)
MPQARTVFFLSDGTGITAQMLGHSLLTQFEGVEFMQVTLPFVDSAEKAEECLARIDAETANGNAQPIVFSTLVNQEVRAVFRRTNALFLDFFETFIDPLEAGLGVKSSHTIGRSHSAMDKKEYQQRIEAINFAMAHDDGASHRELSQADVILIGVSRSGKTPTSLYLAMQFGVKAANYPLIPEDFDRNSLPEALRVNTARLYGLTIAPERLHEIRSERRPDSRYAELDNCRFEIEEAEKLMRREGIRSINSTSKSIEEIATTILRELRIQRQVY